MNAAMSMHVTMMYLAIFLPDWNSLDSVRRAHSDLEATALVFFALLVVFDVLAHLSSEDKKRETILEKIALCCFSRTSRNSSVSIRAEKRCPNRAGNWFLRYQSERRVY